MGGSFYPGGGFAGGGGGGGAPAGLTGGWLPLRSLDFRTLTPGTYTATGEISGVNFRKNSGNLVVSASTGLRVTGGSWDVYLSELTDHGNGVLADYREIAMVMDIEDGFGTYVHTLYNDPVGDGLDGVNSTRTTTDFHVSVYRSAANGGNSNANSGASALGDGGVEGVKRLAVVMEGHSATQYWDRESPGVVGEVTPDDLLYMGSTCGVLAKGGDATNSNSRYVPFSPDGSTDSWQLYDDGNQNLKVKTLSIFGRNP